MQDEPRRRSPRARRPDPGDGTSRRAIPRPPRRPAARLEGTSGIASPRDRGRDRIQRERAEDGLDAATVLTDRHRETVVRPDREERGEADRAARVADHPAAVALRARPSRSRSGSPRSSLSTCGPIHRCERRRRPSSPAAAARGPSARTRTGRAPSRRSTRRPCSTAARRPGRAGSAGAPPGRRRSARSRPRRRRDRPRRSRRRTASCRAVRGSAPAAARGSGSPVTRSSACPTSLYPRFEYEKAVPRARTSAADRGRGSRRSMPQRPCSTPVMSPEVWVSRWCSVIGPNGSGSPATAGAR